MYTVVLMAAMAGAPAVEDFGGHGGGLGLFAQKQVIQQRVVVRQQVFAQPVIRQRLFAPAIYPPPALFNPCLPHIQQSPLYTPSCAQFAPQFAPSCSFGSCGYGAGFVPGGLFAPYGPSAGLSVRTPGFGLRLFR